jgi:hypothetical protein
MGELFCPHFKANKFNVPNYKKTLFCFTDLAKRKIATGG